MWTPIILIGFGIPIFAYAAQFWGKLLRAGVIFAIRQIPKGAANVERPAARPAPVRAWVVGGSTELLPSDRRD